ncbi:beta-ketoacyl synthase, N- domain protein [Burkholderia pseudomallei 576]|nr:beta-ketoacyl synthase, N- domain protein [Burkholderia pseudomallei 576]
MLKSERDAVTEIPPERFGTDFYRHPSKREPGKSYTFSAGVLDNVAGFDAAFFGISPREATQMDPQQRLLLELAWEAFEDAGVRPADMRGSNCGVYVGVAGTDYGNRSMDDLNAIDPYSATGNTLSIASNRVSYLFDLRGPSMSVDTACSSSLVALHQAVQALQSGEAETALAGGVNLLLHPFGFVSFSKASMLSPRGRCRAFDATGDGYVRAEGGAFVLLKPLDRAIADGDTIHAVIAGSGVNSVGHSPGGISVPGAAAQAALLRSVYARAGVDPQSLAYLEAHGTGTAVGDPIEARALIDVVSGARPADRPLLIGSVKTNIGHLETASGMAGLLKAVLCLKHRAVPRSLHFSIPNPAIDFDGGRLRVVDRYMSLEAGNAPLTVGVNSFGFGGTNAHIVLTEAPVSAAVADDVPTSATQAARAPFALVLTARSPNALGALANRYLAALENGGDWQALAAAAARRRQWLEHRAIVAPADAAEGRAALAALARPAPEGGPSCVTTGRAPADAPRTALVFSGNGCQWVGMGNALYAEDAVFRAALDEVDALWCADGSPSLVDVMRGGPGAQWLAGAGAEWLAATENAQPLLFAIQVGMIRVIDARGMRYDAAIGHSVGEVAAAWVTGALSLTDAVRVIKIRSRAQAMTRGCGRMAAVGIGDAAARELIARHGLARRVEIAGVNSPDAVTLAGEPQGLQVLEAALRGSGKFFQMLDLDYAFHSSHMDRIEPVVLAGTGRPAAATGQRRVRIDCDRRRARRQRTRCALLVAQYPRARALRRRHRPSDRTGCPAVRRGLAAFDPAHLREAGARGGRRDRRGAADAQARSRQRGDAAASDSRGDRAWRERRSRPLRAGRVACRVAVLSVAARALLADADRRRLRPRQPPPRTSAAWLSPARTRVRVGKPARSGEAADARRSRRGWRRGVSGRRVRGNGARRGVRLLRYAGCGARERRDSHAGRLPAAAGEAVPARDRAAHRDLHDRDARPDVRRRMDAERDGADA